MRRGSTGYIVRSGLAQAFQQPLLERCGRSHSLEDAHAALHAVRAAAPRSWSLDLISGLPGLTRSAWRESLTAAIAAAPPHVSVYDLQVRRSETLFVA